MAYIDIQVIEKQIEERKRIQRLKNIMRACKDKLYEDAAQVKKIK
jgi:hypothetical protein